MDRDRQLGAVGKVSMAAFSTGPSRTSTWRIPSARITVYLSLLHVDDWRRRSESDPFWGNATLPNCGAATSQELSKAPMRHLSSQSSHGSGCPGHRRHGALYRADDGDELVCDSKGCRAKTFPSPYGSIQASVNALRSSDILYVKDGLKAAGGITVRASSQWSMATAPSSPFVAYPGRRFRLVIQCTTE